MGVLSEMARTNKSVALIGLGISNLGVLESLLSAGISNITVREKKKISLSERFRDRVSIMTGEGYLKGLHEDVIFLSPTVRPDTEEITEAQKAGSRISSDVDFFFQESRGFHLSVTGSDGKSTTVTLAKRLLDASSRFLRVRLGGNIGCALTPFLIDERERDAYVCELSSFQLSLRAPRCDRAVITNLTPNHLDWHLSFDEYIHAKICLLNKAIEPILNLDDAVIMQHSRGINPYAVYTVDSEVKGYSDAACVLFVKDGYIYKNGKAFFPLPKAVAKDTCLVKNLLAAIALTDGYASLTDVMSVMRDYRPLPHRCERIGVIHGVSYYDSSIDSTPHRTAATLSSFSVPVILLLGGRGKGVSYLPLLPAMKKHVRLALITGDNAEEIAEALSGGGVPFLKTASLEESVRIARQCACENDAVLLSPASTSFDRYQNYVERAEHFRSLVNALDGVK